jgi:hypothetical protein
MSVAIRIETVSDYLLLNTHSPDIGCQTALLFPLPENSRTSSISPPNQSHRFLQLGTNVTPPTNGRCAKSIGLHQAIRQPENVLLLT